MGPRKITLRKDAHCVVCAHALTARTLAWWDDVARSITCLACAATPTPSGTPSGGNGLFPGVASARPTTAHPMASSTWRAAREARLSSRLRSDLAGRATVLDDRWVPPTKSRIDHLVIAPTGVWLIGSTQHTGKVVHRDVGSYLRTETRLFVDGRDRTSLVTGLDGQVRAVRAALAAADIGTVPVRPVLCFTNSEWGLLARSFSINGVLVTWASKLAQRILDGPALHGAEPMHVAAVLTAALPAAG
jgi:hypothetical protein